MVVPSSWQPLQPARPASAPGVLRSRFPASDLSLSSADHGEQLEAINLVVGKARFKVLLLLLRLEVTQARVLAVADKARLPNE